MQFFYEIFPIFLFFIVFKFYGIYAATVVGIVCTFLQVIMSRVWTKKWDNKQLITLSRWSLNKFNLDSFAALLSTACLFTLAGMFSTFTLGFMDILT